MTAYYPVAQVAELVEALNRIMDERHRAEKSPCKQKAAKRSRT